MLRSDTISIIGIGNADCGDDAAGPAIVDRLSDRIMPENVRLLKSGGETAGLIEILSQCEMAILVDALSSSSKPGSIHRFDASNEPLPADLFSPYSTHGMGVVEAVEMARVLGDFPNQVIVFGIEGLNFDPGSSMSTEVVQNLSSLTEAIVQEISALTKN